jgi:hypothetical protein
MEGEFENRGAISEATIVATSSAGMHCFQYPAFSPFLAAIVTTMPNIFSFPFNQNQTLQIHKHVQSSLLRGRGECQFCQYEASPLDFHQGYTSGHRASFNKGLESPQTKVHAWAGAPKPNDA